MWPVIIGFFIVVMTLCGSVLALGAPTSEEKTELELLTRQVRGIAWLLLAIMGLLIMNAY